MIRQLVADFFKRLFSLLPADVPASDLLESEPMITTVFRVTVTTGDGRACLELEKDKQMFVPRVDDTLHVTDVVQKDKSEIEADVAEVVYDPVQEVATVYGATDLDMAEGHKIDDIVESAKEDGWIVYGDIEYFGSVPCAKCPSTTSDLNGDQ